MPHSETSLGIPPCDGGDHLNHSFDLVTTLRSELAAISYKRDRLVNELTDAKSSLCAKETECETVRAQAARQTTLISSLQSRIQAAEMREKNLAQKSEAMITALQRDKRCLEEKNKDICARLRRMECDLGTEEGQKETLRTQIHDIVRRLALCLGMDVCETTHLSADTVLAKAGDMVTELQKMRMKVTSSCETITNCEAELLNLRSASVSERQRMQSQLDGLQSLNQDLESRVRQMEKEMLMTRDRLTESEVGGDKLREELRGFESRCGRLQNNIDRFQNDRLQFLRNIAGTLSLNEPCETLIKDKVREMAAQHHQMHNVGESYMSCEQLINSFILFHSNSLHFVNK